MQHAAWVRRCMRGNCGDAEGSVDATEPFAVRGKILHGQTADDILHCLLDGCAFPLADYASALAAFGVADGRWLITCTDRRSTNDVAIRWLAARLRPSLHSLGSVVVHAEYCVPHALAIAKSRFVDAKAKGSSISSLSKLMRDGRFKSALISELGKLVAESLVVRCEPRPPSHLAHSQRLMEAMCCGADSAHACRLNGDGTKVEKPWLVSMRRFLEVVDFDDPTGMLVHWCHRACPSTLAGQRCCSDDDTARQHVVDTVLGCLFATAWEEAAVERWTWISKILKRFMLASLGPRLLPRALASLQALWGVDASAEALLSRMVAADNEDFVSQRKLKLCRVCRHLCVGPVLPELGVVLSVISIVDEVCEIPYGVCIMHLPDGP